MEGVLLGLAFIIVFILVIYFVPKTTYEEPIPIEQCQLATTIAEYEESRRQEVVLGKIHKLNPLYKITPELIMAIINSSDKYNVPEDLLIALIFVESSFFKYAISHAECYGYMQLNPRAHPWIERDNLFDTLYNIDSGSRILKEYYDQNPKAGWETALIRYNGWYPNSPFADIVYNVKATVKE